MIANETFLRLGHMISLWSQALKDAKTTRFDEFLRAKLVLSSFWKAPAKKTFFHFARADSRLFGGPNVKTMLHVFSGA